MMPKVRRGFLLWTGICTLLVLLFAIAVPNLLRWRVAQGERTPVTDLCRVDAAVRAYAAEHGSAPTELRVLQGQLSGMRCEDGSCEYRGYQYRYTVEKASTPARYSIWSQRAGGFSTSFYLDESGVMRHTVEDREATRRDEPVEGSSRPCEKER